MKFTLILLFASLLQVNAATYAQKVTLSVKKASFEQVLQNIQEQTGYRFLYTEDMVGHAKPVSIHVVNAELAEVLKQCFLDQPLTYTLREKTIIIKEKEKSLTETIIDFFTAVEVRGKVSDENGYPLPGATVKIKGTKTATVANGKGEFSFNNIEETAILEISFLGYITSEVRINTEATMNIVLKPDRYSMQEAVIVAYGSTKKVELTGSVSVIGSKELADLSPTINIDGALLGKAAGVQVVQETGQPGSSARVRIRGASSLLGSNQPLYVIDGVPVVSESNIPDNGLVNEELLKQGLNSPLGNINPSDIESVTVLKDASATAIYGSRAANGVVVITTKKGSAKGPQYSFTSSLSVQEAQTEKVLNPQQFREMWTEAAKNSTSTAAVIPKILDGSYFGNANTNWQDEVSQSNPVTKNINFSIAGGSEKIRYYAGLSNQDQAGVFDNSKFNRYSFLVNLDARLADRVSVGTSLNLSSSNQMAPDAGLLARIYTYRPDLPVYNDQGNFLYSDYVAAENPVALSTATNRNKTNMLLGSVFGTYQINDALNFKSSLSINSNTGNLNSFYSSQTNKGGSTRAGGPGLGFGQEGTSESLSHIWENTLSLDKHFKEKHYLNGVLGASWQGDNSEFLQASGKGFPQDMVLTNLSSATQDFTIASSKTQSGLESYFGRVNYIYDEKYLLTLSARTDGSSKFAEENKWAFFPTIAGAWRLSNENFLKNVSFINELKLRASIGVTGQQNFGAYQARSLFSSSNYGGLPAVIQNQLGNSRLRWELTRQSDLGLDLSILGGRLNGTFDYYKKHTKDLLYFIKVPGNVGFSTVIGNLGETENKGVEFALDGDVLKGKDFKWNLGFNIARNANKLLKLNDDFLNNTSGVITPPNTGSILKVGESLGLLYGYVADGLFQTQAEIDLLNSTAAGNIYQAAGTAPGDLKFRDITGPDGVPDGKVTALDQTIIGNAQPDFYGGFTNTFEYKGFRLSSLFTYSVGNDLRWGTQSTAINFLNTGSENKLDMVLNRWTPQNPTTQPRAVYGDPNSNGRISSYYVHDASFLALKNVHFSYSIPENLLHKTGFIKSAMFYINGSNLFTGSQYPGANPETSNLYNDDVSTGLDNSRYPISKVYTAGFRFGF